MPQDMPLPFGQNVIKQKVPVSGRVATVHLYSTSLRGHMQTFITVKTLSVECRASILYICPFSVTGFAKLSVSFLFYIFLLSNMWDPKNKILLFFFFFHLCQGQVHGKWYQMAEKRNEFLGTRVII